MLAVLSPHVMGPIAAVVRAATKFTDEHYGDYYDMRAGERVWPVVRCIYVGVRFVVLESVFACRCRHYVVCLA